MAHISNKPVFCGAALLGVGLWVGMSLQFAEKDKLHYEPNVACVKGSPYGKVVALAVQGPIDLYWHKGESHDDMEALAEHSKEKHGCGAGCSHECGAGCDHGHDHGHDHDSSASKHDFTEAGEEVAALEEGGQEEPLHAKARARIKLFKAFTRRRTDGKPLTAAHLKYLQSVTEDKLRFAYELDPSNYTNYSNYHLFVSSTTFGKNKADEDASVKLAKKTIAFCKKDEVDPASWLTAANAAYNVMYHIGKHHEDYTVAEAKASISEFDNCMKRFNTLLEKSVSEGRIASQERLDQMQRYASYMKKLRYAQGQYMKRMMLGKQAQYITESPTVK